MMVLICFDISLDLYGWFHGMNIDAINDSFPFIFSNKTVKWPGMRNISNLFSEKAAEILPEHRKFDMNIELKDEKILPAHGRINNPTADEDKILFE